MRWILPPLLCVGHRCGGAAVGDHYEGPKLCTCKACHGKGWTGPAGSIRSSWNSPATRSMGMCSRLGWWRPLWPSRCRMCHLCPTMPTRQALQVPPLGTYFGMMHRRISARILMRWLDCDSSCVLTRRPGVVTTHAVASMQCPGRSTDGSRVARGRRARVGRAFVTSCGQHQSIVWGLSLSVGAVSASVCWLCL